MADPETMLTIGAVVNVSPAIGADIQGEIMAFDAKARILVLSKYGIGIKEIVIAIFLMAWALVLSKCGIGIKEIVIAIFLMAWAFLLPKAFTTSYCLKYLLTRQ